MKKKSLEKHLKKFLKNLETQKESTYEYHFHQILDAFEDFLISKPEPPQEWKDRLGEQAHKFDYHQIVLPGDFEDPFEDELGNIRRLRAEFESNTAPLALEHLLISQNYFIFENRHATVIEAPRPLLMLESTDAEGSKIDWDCCVSVFADASYYAYNLLDDEEEVLGDDITAVLESQMIVLSEMQLVIPVEGRDYGFLRSC
ncbi:MAG: hypothetical protein GX116_08845 [Fibrobacter sp.]|jgi:hypothetical protein|nr:hypothetical protein [Fibrobacter sp.]